MLKFSEKMVVMVTVAVVTDLISAAVQLQNGAFLLPCMYGKMCGFLISELLM